MLSWTTGVLNNRKGRSEKREVRKGVLVDMPQLRVRQQNYEMGSNKKFEVVCVTRSSIGYRGRTSC